MGKTLGERLASVQKAIEQVEAGQEYEIDGRKLKRADLEVLYRQEERLLRQIEQFGADYDPTKQKPVTRKANVRFI